MLPERWLVKQNNYDEDYFKVIKYLNTFLKKYEAPFKGTLWNYYGMYCNQIVLTDTAMSYIKEGYKLLTPKQVLEMIKQQEQWIPKKGDIVANKAVPKIPRIYVGVIEGG